MQNLDLLIVTPSLNAEEFVEDCINSTKKLRSFGARHIFVDSGSSDRTVEIIKSYGLSIYFEPPGNMYAAINCGVQQFQNKWITYINVDDLLYSDSVIAALDKDLTGVDVLYGNLDFIRSSGHFLHNWRSAPTSDLSSLFASRIMPFPQQGTFIRRELFEKLNGFSVISRYCSDFDFFNRAKYFSANFKKSEGAPLAAFRLHESQISQNYTETMRKETLESTLAYDLNVTRISRIRAKISMRLRNIDSYILRFIRYIFLNRKLKFNTSMQID